MEDSDDEEGHIEDDQDGTLFDKTTNMYKDYKLAEGSIADQWAREANLGLHLNWKGHPTELSHYSHGDCGGLGFRSTMEKKLGIEPSNQVSQPNQQPAFRRTEPIPTQVWEFVGIGPIGRGAGTEIWSGKGLNDVGTAASQADTNLDSQLDIDWDEWIHPDAW